MNRPRLSYDEPSDTLVVAFAPGQAATSIELNDHILLRIDKEQRRAISLTFLDYSLLAQTADYGPRSFPVTGLAHLPEDLRALVLEILQTGPVNEVLALSTYTPSYAEAVPITAIHKMPLSMAG